MDIREKILEAASRIYSECGFRGTTTRRVAQEAGVNEVTLFRHFGSKEVLIREAVQAGWGRVEIARLPDVPVDPAVELTHWAEGYFEVSPKLSRSGPIRQSRSAAFDHQWKCPGGSLAVPGRLGPDQHEAALAGGDATFRRAGGGIGAPGPKDEQLGRRRRR